MLQRLANSQWNRGTAAHLLNRAAFGGTPTEIEQLTQRGLEGAVDWLVEYERQPAAGDPPEWAKPDPSRGQRFREMREIAQQFKDAPEERRKALEAKRREFQREERRTQQEHLQELRAWWLRRMAFGPRPFEEKMTLFWHGHFATSMVKVRDAYLMWRQNETLRQQATGGWLPLLVAVSKDPAMLVWLDQAQSRKSSPNENYAREVMELFTLGEGHYAEKDVTEAARAFTGWGYDRVNQAFVQRRAEHDSRTKSVLGRTGDLDGEDVLKAIVAQPQASRFIAGKLWEFFAATPVSAVWGSVLGKEFESHGQVFKPFLRSLFLSEAFYAPSVVRQQVKSPVQWLVNSVKVLERDLPAPGPASNALRSLGQELFAPPNVKGWDGGLSWITTNNLLNRYNAAWFLLTGADPSRAGDSGAGARRRASNAVRNTPVDMVRLFPPVTRANPGRALRAIEERLFQGTLRPASSQPLLKWLEAQPEIGADEMLRLLHMAMSTADFQLT